MRRLYPEAAVGGFSRLDGQIEFYTRINALVDEKSRVLDFGAGRGHWAVDPMPEMSRRLRMLRGRVAEVVGTDVDPAVLTNPALDTAQVVPLGDRLPFADDSFDLVIADHVLEHVNADDAQDVADDVLRVLRPGGWLAARTPNKWGMIGIGARAVPNRLHVRMLRRLQPDRKAEDVFPTRYTMNTRRDLGRLFSEHAARLRPHERADVLRSVAARLATGGRTRPAHPATARTDAHDLRAEAAVKILVEAMCAEFGGIRTYVEHLLARWSEVYPDDAARDRASRLVAAHRGARAARGRGAPTVDPRPSLGADPLAASADPSAATRCCARDPALHDRPASRTSPGGRALRPAARAEARAVQPQASAAAPGLVLARVPTGRRHRLDLAAQSRRPPRGHPSTCAIPSAVAHLGADHVEQWPAPSAVGPCVTFAHHTNKNVGLLVGGWSELVRRGHDVPPLLMLGVPGAQRDELVAQLAAHGLSDHVQLAPFLPEERFQQVMAEAEMIVFPHRLRRLRTAGRRRDAPGITRRDRARAGDQRGRRRARHRHGGLVGDRLGRRRRDRQRPDVGPA
ncbi:methyltransferase domain-containing protein [Aeromicrobium sp. UC242_57]